MRAKEIDRHRPTLTKRQVVALRVGSKIRSICGTAYHVIALSKGRYGELVATLAYWRVRHACWDYVAATGLSLTILYTPYRIRSTKRGNGNGGDQSPLASGSS